MSKKETKEKIDVDAVHLALCDLRNRNIQNDAYIKVLTILQYKDPASIRPAQFDAVLIKAADELFLGVDKDIVLMSLGLLQGYKRNKKIDKRQKKYLRCSNYIQDVYYDNPEPYDKIDFNLKKAYTKTLIETEEKRIKSLAHFLVRKKKNGDLEQYIKNLGRYYDDTKDIAILPKPYYLKNTLEKNAIATKEKKQKSITVAIELLTVCIGCMTSIIVFFQDIIPKKANQNALEFANKIEKPSSIKFDNPEEYLPLDEDLYLTLNTIPHNAELNGLECESSDPDIVKVVSKSNLHLKAAKELNDDQKRNVQIQAYMSDDTSIKDEMTIHIIESGKNEDIRSGQLTDKSSGHYSQKIK